MAGRELFGEDRQTAPAKEVSPPLQVVVVFVFYPAEAVLAGVVDDFATVNVQPWAEEDFAGEVGVVAYRRHAVYAAAAEKTEEDGFGLVVGVVGEDDGRRLQL